MVISSTTFGAFKYDDLFTLPWRQYDKVWKIIEERVIKKQDAKK